MYSLYAWLKRGTTAEAHRVFLSAFWLFAIGSIRLVAAGSPCKTSPRQLSTEPELSLR